VTEVTALRHVLTHFDFFATVHILQVSQGLARKVSRYYERQWVAPDALSNYGIPEVMKKAFHLVQEPKAKPTLSFAPPRRKVVKKGASSR
jgi:hypothetical protein